MFTTASATQPAAFVDVPVSSPTSRYNTISTPEPLIAHAPEPNVILVESGHNASLVYVESPDRPFYYQANLTPLQLRQIETMILSALRLPTIPLYNVVLQSGPGYLSVFFSINPTHLMGEAILTGSYWGLANIYVSAIRANFSWDLLASGIKRPEWLQQHKTY
jgi:hypothetical protein